MAADYFIQKNEHFPKIFETGKDYVVAEYVPRNDSVARKYLKPLQEFSQVDFENKTSALQDTLEKMGLSDFMNYDLLWNDFKAVRNWGVRPDGTPVLIDEGVLTKEVTSGSKISDMVQKDWNDILRMRKGAKPESATKVERYQ